MPPAFVDRLPPIWQLPSALRLSGNSRPAFSAAACTSARIQPASTVMDASSGSTLRIPFMRDVESSTCAPLWSGIAPPQRPVLPPWGTRPILCRPHTRTMSLTCCVEDGDSITAVRPVTAPRLSLRCGSRSLASFVQPCGPTMALSSSIGVIGAKYRLLRESIPVNIAAAPDKNHGLASKFITLRPE